MKQKHHPRPFMRSLFILISLLLVSIAQAQKIYTIDDVQAVHLQHRERYTSDPEQILSAASRDSIDAMLYRLDRTKGIETAVVVLPAIEGGDCFDFAYNLFNKWGVGKKNSNMGLVILLCTGERCIQFVTSQGLEGDLPDAICKRIQTQYMIPYLRDGNWNSGLVAGVKATGDYLQGVPDVLDDETADEDLEDLGSIILICLFFFGIVFAWALWKARQATRCPQCKQYGLVRVGSQLVSKRHGVRTMDITYRCKHCGHRLVRRTKEYDENYHRRNGGGGIFVGGGFSGGSYGGGFSAGGGAGSRF